MIRLLPETNIPFFIDKSFVFFGEGSIPVVQFLLTHSGGRQKLDRGISYERVLQWN